MTTHMRALLVIVACLVLLPGTGRADPFNALVNISVNPSKVSLMPSVTRAGVFTFKPDPPAYAMEQWLTEMRPGVVEIDIGGSVFQMAQSEADVLERARKLVPLLKRIYGGGGVPVLAISRIPVWMSSRPKAIAPVAGDVVPVASVVAPRDGAAWAALVSQVILVFKTSLGRTPDIKVGWEPDQSAWQGSEADFFAFYRDTAYGVKRADPSARVGGPSVSALFNGKGGETAPALMPRFLRYCALTPLPELGLTRLPVDFVVWHQFGTDAVLSWDMAATQVRSWLKEAGYPVATDLFIGEWSSWLAWPSPDSPEHDRPAVAAYIVASTLAMGRAGIQHAAFTSLTEQREVEAQAFIGSFGLFTNQLIKKPSYWAFSALGKLGDKQVKTSSDDPLVSAIAGLPKPGELALLVATSTPGEKALLRTFVAKIIASGVGISQIKDGLSMAQMMGLMAGELNPASLDIGAPSKRAVTLAVADVGPVFQSARAARGQTRTVRVKVANWDLEKSHFELWRIDSGHANAWAHRGRIGDFLQKRLQQEKQALSRGLLGRFQALGYKDEAVDWFTQTMNSRNRDAALAARPPHERAVVKALADASQEFINERLGSIGQEINAWPELAFKANDVPRRVGSFLEFEMESDSVVLLRALRN